MENELSIFTKICISVFISICYSYTVGRIVSKGIRRLFCLVPVVFLLLYLPLNLSTVHIGGLASFFVGWMLNFKLLLFAFGKGPLSSDTSLSLGRFVAAALLPIKSNQYNYPTPNRNEQLHDGKRTVLSYAVKAMIYALLLCFYNSDYIHPKIIVMVQFLVIYLELDILLTILAAMVRLLTGVELEPQFHKPYLSSSLQDFWGRRWNIMVSRILRSSVYEPIRNLNMPYMGCSQATPAVLGTFLVSGLMHDYIFYCMMHERPAWEMTFFFVHHGLFLAVEISLKKAVGGRWRLPWLISGPWTVGIHIASAYWLFLPPLKRCRAFERGFEEVEALRLFAEHVIQRLRIL